MNNPESVDPGLSGVFFDHDVSCMEIVMLKTCKNTRGGLDPLSMPCNDLSVVQMGKC